MKDDDQNSDANRDPMTSALCAPPESKRHGTIVAGPEARAAAGAVEEPSPGAVPGERAGTGVAAATDPTYERAYWSANFRARDYVEPGSSFDDYGPAYGFGVAARGRNPGRDFDDVESEMSSEWAHCCGASSLSWELARPAARDAWNRVGASN